NIKAGGLWREPARLPTMKESFPYKCEAVMFVRHVALRATAAGALLVVAACFRTDDLTGPSASQDLHLSQAGRVLTQDDLDRDVPGFGGFFVDRNGVPTVYLRTGA